MTTPRAAVAGTGDAGSATTRAAPDHPLRVVVAVTLSGTIGVAPVFLLGAMALLVREDLGFDTAQLGLAVAAFWTANALAAVPGGRAAEVLGARRAILAGTAVSALALLAVSLFVRTWGALVGVLAVAGAAYAVAGPAAGLAIARGVHARHQGVAFGLKQASPPIAAMVAGVALPVVALTLGWRWGFALPFLLVPIVAAVLPADGHVRPRSYRGLRSGDAATGPVVVMALVGACGGILASSVGTFFVESAVANGWTQRSAGLLLAVGSVLSIITRVISGRVTDKRGSRVLPVVVVMLLVGSTGLLLLAIGHHHALFVVGALLAMGPGWGWQGLMQLAVVRVNPNAPGAATGITLAGGASGAVLGPLVFAALVDDGSFTAAWLALAGVSTACAAMVVFARTLLRRDITRREGVAVAALSGSPGSG